MPTIAIKLPLFEPTNAKQQMYQHMPCGMDPHELMILDRTHAESLLKESDQIVLQRTKG